MKKIVLISKDAVSKNYLPAYYNRYWKTPNIDELAKRGTVYNRHYSVAPSTNMAFYSMICAEYCYQTACTDYGDERPFYGETIFDKFENIGFNSYLIWDESYTRGAKTHLRIINGKTNLISLNIIPHIPPHIKGVFDDLSFDHDAAKKAMDQIKNTFVELSEKQENAFIWLHLPHVLAGRNSYCSDIDLFDEVVGYAREIFGDDSIFVSADHGNMDGKKGKFGYGFDLEETVICIPLISPKVGDYKEINFLTSNLNLFEILNLNPIHEELVICDTAYYCQSKRKIALIKDNYKLVYIKEKKRFELFDLRWDPEEKYNLFYPEFYDVDRRTWFSLNQRFYYPFWDQAFTYKKMLENEFNKIWRKGPFIIEIKNKIKFKIKYVISNLLKKQKSKTFENVGK